MYIVIRQRHTDGRIIGSMQPFIHQNLGSAKKEAKRLAKLMPLDTFFPMRSLNGCTYHEEPKYAAVFN